MYAELWWKDNCLHVQEPSAIWNQTKNAARSEIFQGIQPDAVMQHGSVVGLYGIANHEPPDTFLKDRD